MSIGEMDLWKGRTYGIHGLPGIGKSHLAIEFAYRHEQDFSHIFWLPSDSEEKLEQGYLKIASSLGLISNTIGVDREKIIGMTRSWLKKQTDGKTT
jgi:hypothetical protein